MRYLWLLLACILTLGLTGCAGKDTSSGQADVTGTEEVTVKNKYAQVVSMEQTAIVNYIVPETTPNILVDLQGYCVGEDKHAVVKGVRLPEEFCVVDEAEDKVVYTGAIEDVTYDKKQGVYMGYADFSQVETAGDYHLECDIVGYSESFAIREKQYEVLLADIYGRVMELCDNKTLAVADAIVVLQTYEWYGVVFPDNDGGGIPDVLEALKKWVSHMEENGVEEGQEALYAAFLAKFSYHYQKFDYQYATDCLQRASTVYGQVQKTLTKDSDIFLALAELYRATNHYKYRKQILEYDTFFEKNSGYPDKPGYIYGGLTYLVTRHSVDKGLCEFFINHVMDRGEEISGGYEESIHPVSAKNNGVEDLLKRAMELSCANYVLNNYQYTNIIKEFLHYLMGRNLKSMDFYENGEDCVEYLMLLAQLVANHVE